MVWRDNPCGYTLRGERVAFRAASSARFVGKKLRRPSVREDCFLYSHHARFCAGFRTPGSREPPHDEVAGGRKAPRHEVAGSWARAKQRALWRIDAGAELDDRRDGDRI